MTAGRARRSSPPPSCTGTGTGMENGNSEEFEYGFGYWDVPKCSNGDVLGWKTTIARSFHASQIPPRLSEGKVHKEGQDAEKGRIKVTDGTWGMA